MFKKIRKPELPGEREVRPCDGHPSSHVFYVKQIFFLFLLIMKIMFYELFSDWPFSLTKKNA